MPVSTETLCGFGCLWGSNRVPLSGSGWRGEWERVSVCEKERERCQCHSVPCSWLRLLSRPCRTSPAPWDPNLWALLIKNHGLGSWDAGGGHNRLSTECSKGGVGHEPAIYLLFKKNVHLLGLTQRGREEELAHEKVPRYKEQIHVGFLFDSTV